MGAGRPGYCPLMPGHAGRPAGGDFVARPAFRFSGHSVAMALSAATSRGCEARKKTNFLLLLRSTKMNSSSPRPSCGKGAWKHSWPQSTITVPKLDVLKTRKRWPPSTLMFANSTGSFPKRHLDEIQDFLTRIPETRVLFHNP